jgi:hypothetical protein
LLPFHCLLIHHVHPLSHVLIVCLDLEYLGCLLLTYLLIQLLFDISESLLSLELLPLLIQRVLMFLFDLILDHTSLELPLRLIALFNHCVCHAVHKESDLFFTSLPLSLPFLLLNLYHLVVLLYGTVLLLSFTLFFIEHLSLLHFIFLNNFECNLPLILLFIDLSILFIINLLPELIHQFKLLHPLFLRLMLLQLLSFTQLHIPHLLLLEYLVLHFALLGQLLLLLLSHPLQQLLLIGALLLTLLFLLQSLFFELFVQDLPQTLLFLHEGLLLLLLLFFKLLFLKEDDLIPFIFREVTWEGLLVGG